MALAALALGTSTAAARPSDLDPSFSGDGWTSIDSGGDETAYATAVQPDGRVVVVGSSTVNHDAVVYRLNPNGSLDDTFAVHGTRVLDDGQQEEAHAVALQPDGRVLLAGWTTSGGGDAMVWRLKPNGQLDTSFAGGDEVRLNAGGFDQATSIAVQPNGKIVLAGDTSFALGEADGMVWRLRRSGQPDAAFGDQGTLRLPSAASRWSSVSRSRATARSCPPA